MRRLQCALLSAVAAIGFASMASAADMPAKAPVLKAAPAVPVASWTGCYVGVSAGGMWGRTSGYSSDATSTFGTGGANIGYVGPLTDPFNVNSVIGGGFAGCNYQTGTWVFGVEGDWSSMNAKGSAFLTNAAAAAGINPLRQWTLNEHWLATVRGRLGYAWGNTMLYATGGVAWAKIDSQDSATNDPADFTFAVSDTRSGWTVGAGVEHMLGMGFTVRGEYLYVDFPNWTTFTSTPLASAAITNNHLNLQNHIFRVGLAYKFGG